MNTTSLYAFRKKFQSSVFEWKHTWNINNSHTLINKIFKINFDKFNNIVTKQKLWLQLVVNTDKFNMSFKNIRNPNNYYLHNFIDHKLLF